MRTESIASSYNRNLSVATDALQLEAEMHGGQLVARSTDGLNAFCYADTYDELFALLEKQQIDPSDAVIARVRLPDEGCLF